jgi:putative Holliday junction resolvase
MSNSSGIFDKQQPSSSKIMVMSQKPRLLGLDVGDKRIGVAISDPLGITAAGLECIERKNMATDLATVKALALRHGVVEIIVGLPQNMDGSEGEQCQKVRSFARKLARVTGLPVVYEDERLSTFTAIRMLTVQGVKTGQRRDLVDIQSAAVILQMYLDNDEPPPSA